MLNSTRRAVLVLAAALTTLAAPAVAGARLLSPGDVATAAYTRMDAETFARDPALKKSDFENERVDGGATAQSSYRWPPPPFTGPVAFSCAPTGCTGYDGRAFGRADVAAGRLQAVAHGSLYIGNPPSDGYGLAGYIFADGAAAIADTITLSKPATVILRGSIEGRTGGSNSHYDEQGNDPETEVDVSISFTGDGMVCDVEWCQRERFGGIKQEYEATIVHCSGTCAAPGDLIDELLYEDHSDTFEVAVQLPAGTSYFNAELAAALDYQVYGERDELVRKWATLDFGSSVEFEIEVPDDVVATSGSGLLPIVGGAVGTPDTTPPVVVAPASLTVDNAAGTCAATPAVGTATATDDRGEATVAGTRSDGEALDAAYPVGTTTITWTATDAAGNTATATQTVAVRDAESPTLSTPADRVVDNDPGQATAVVALVAPTASDNCPAPAVTGARSDGEALSQPFPVGTTTVTWTATDAAGNTATVTQTVAVRDVEKPVLALPGSQTVNATSPSGAVVAYSATATDNVGVATLSCTPASGATFPVGATTVTCTAADAAGNTASGTLTITVRGAADQLRDVIGKIRARLNLGPRENGIVQRLESALDRLESGRPDVACTLLETVEQQLDRFGTADAAEALADVRRIGGSLGCG